MAEYQGLIVNAGDITDLRIAGPALATNKDLFAKVPLPGLLAWAACTKATGVLSVTGPAGQVTDMVLKDGAIQTVGPRGESLWRQVVADLVARKEVSEEDARKSEALAAATGRSQLQILFEMGACVPKTLVDAMRSRKNTELDAILALKQAPYAYKDGLPPGHRPDPVVIDLVTWIFNLVRTRSRISHAADIEPLFHEVFGKYPTKAQRLTPMVLGTCMNDRERKVIEDFVDGTNSVRDILTMSLLGRTQTARLVLACHVAGLFEYRDIPLPKGGIAALEAELERTLDRTRNEDFFTRLTTHWTTHPSLFAEAYKKMQERWGPGALVRRQSEKAARLAEEIFALMTEAYETLSDTKKRQEYRLALLGEAKLKFGTDLLYKQAHMAAFRGEIAMARQFIESAIDILPEERFKQFLHRVGGA